MNAQTPFSRRGEGARSIGKWALMGSGPDAELGRLEAYCAEMNSREPRKWMVWCVVTREDGKREVDCRERFKAQSQPRPDTSRPALGWMDG